MKIQQFEDKGLAHYSYIIMSDAEIAVVDPTRNPRQYEEFAMLHDAKITAILETHPHADFVSGHLELSQTKQTPIYVSSLVEAQYKHQPFDNGDEIKIGKVTLRALQTPGHSADSISFLLLDEEGKEHAVFTGDALLLGDVGRPDLRENPEDESTSARALARLMYYSVHQVYLKLPDDVLVYPAHGAGSLCAKNSSDAKSSTIGEERKTNPALQPMSEEAFIEYLVQGQPFVPKYFASTVETNRQGCPHKFESAVKEVPVLEPDHELAEKYTIVDARPQHLFKRGHLPHALNIQDGAKFETWLGSILAPDEKFYLIAENEEALTELIARTATIGYERNIKGAFASAPAGSTQVEPVLDLAAFKANPSAFTVVDVRNPDETAQQKIFANAVAIPLPELRARAAEVPTDKPVVVHCAGGYRSAAAASILAQNPLGVPVYDLSDAIKEFSGPSHH